MSEEIPVYTVTCEYAATGEGITFFILITHSENPIERFKELFHPYYAIGAEVREGVVFDEYVGNFLVGPELQAKLKEWNDDAGSFEYYTQLHVNFA